MSAFSRRLRAVFTAATLAASFFSPGAATAQMADWYGAARGWNVSAFWNDAGTLTACEAYSDNREGDTWIGIGYGPVNGLTMLVPYPWQGSGDVPGWLSASRELSRVTWTIHQDYAWTRLSADWWDLLQQGSSVSWEVNGQPGDHGLSGSAAAMLKLEECVQRDGHVQAAPAPVPPSMPAPPGVDNDAYKLGANCPQYGQYRSPASSAAAHVRFTNTSDIAVSLYWIGFEGEFVEYAGLLPGESAEIDTYSGHYWIAKDFNWTCHGGVISIGQGDGFFNIP